MTKDRLYLLNPDFRADGKSCYCPECAELNGVINFYPTLKEKLDIRYVDFPRPRAEIIQEIGEQNQGCPVLVIGSPKAEVLQGADIGEANGRKFISGAKQIGLYLAKAYGIGEPH